MTRRDRVARLFRQLAEAARRGDHVAEITLTARIRRELVG